MTTPMLRPDGSPMLLPLHTLTATQQQILAAPASGEIVVGGLAGSGKTLAAVHRALRLASEQVPSGARTAVLFLCFNQALAARIRGLLAQGDAAAQGRVVVKTVHQWCYPAVRRRFPDHEVADDGQRLDLLRAALGDVAREQELPERELGFWSEALRRLRGGVPLSTDGADGVSQGLRGVALAYEGRLRAAGLIDYDDFAPIALADRRLRATAAHVIVDEAQDLSPLQLDVCRAAARSSLLIVADQAQAIYKVGELERELPAPSEYDIYLAASQRCSAEILALAGRLLPHAPPELPARHGPAPRYQHFDWSDEEADFVATMVAELIASGERPESIAVIVRLRELIPELAAALERVGVPLARGERTGVALTTIHEAKGREFETVFVVGLVEGVLPRVMPELDREAAAAELALARRQLYVALTRARTRLFLTSSEGPPSRFLAELGFEPGGQP